MPVFWLPVVTDTFALPMVGLLANAESCNAPSAVGHETVRNTRFSIPLLEAPGD